MRMRTFAPLRIIAAGLAALTLSVAAGELTGAQDEQEPSGDAQIIRDLVHAQRERVLEEIAANMAGERDDAEPRVIEDAEPEDGEAEDGEPEAGEPEDGEPEDGEPEDGEPEGDEAAGGEGEACEPAASEPGAEADAAAAEDGEASASEGDGGQPEGAEPEASGETTVCDLPATGIGATHESTGGLPFVAALVALTAAGLGLRRRFCVV
jgi:uncharacterized protein (TIGR03382 family)